MHKSWRLYQDIVFADEPGERAKPGPQVASDEPDPVEIFRNREMSVHRLFETPMELDRWIDLFLGDDQERFRYAHLFYDIAKSGGTPVPEEPRIYYGKISRIETADRLRIWLEPPPHEYEAYFEVTAPHDDHLREWSPGEWQSLLDDFQHPDVTLFAVGSYYGEEWHAQRYVASSPSLIRTR